MHSAQAEWQVAALGHAQPAVLRAWFHTPSLVEPSVYGYGMLLVAIGMLGLTFDAWRSHVQDVSGQPFLPDPWSLPGFMEHSVVGSCILRRLKAPCICIDALMDPEVGIHSPWHSRGLHAALQGANFQQTYTVPRTFCSVPARANPGAR